jgi:acyl-CoA dehydrogenase
MTADYSDICAAVARLCEDFPGPYWRELDRRRAYPSEFVGALASAGYLSILIPERYGGSGLGVAAAAPVLEGI